MFPSTFKYSAPLPYSDLDKSQIIEHVKQAIESKKANIVFIGNDELIYSGTTDRFAGRGNFARSVDKGIFRLLQTNSGSILEYEIYMATGIYFSLGFSILAGLVSFNIWIALFFLFWFGGINMLSTYFQHSNFFHYVQSRLKPGADNIDEMQLPRVLTQGDKKEMGVGILIVLLFMMLLIFFIMLSPF